MQPISARSATLLGLLALAPAVGVTQVHVHAEPVNASAAVGVVARAQYIVQASSSQAASASAGVARVGGEVRGDLSVINAVAADLSVAQAADLRLMSDVRLFSDRRLTPLGASKLDGAMPLVLTDGYG